MFHGWGVLRHKTKERFVGKFKNNEMYVQAGAGIVADSVPEKEYLETINKSAALFKAAEMSYYR